MTLERIKQHGCFGGTVEVYQHTSEAVGGLPMTFAVFRPPRADEPLPVLYYLSGLTCTWENVMAKAGAQRYAAEHGLLLVCPDTSPRGAGVKGEEEGWDLGTGAGFYLDATQAPWSAHYRMESYITDELPALITQHFPADPSRVGVTGHSMGGHGALTLGLRHPELYRSVSALAPICAPTQCPWGHKAFGAYLGDDREAWKAHDACALIAQAPRPELTLLVDQGLDDGFLQEQLKPEFLEAACQAADQPLTLRRHTGYDHSYYFVSSVIGDHIAHHAAALT